MKYWGIFTDTAGIPHKKGGPVNRTGYLRGAKTNRNKMNIIPSSHITTKNMAMPIWANGMHPNGMETGGMMLLPDTGDYHFPTPYVVERKMSRKMRGGRVGKMQQGGEGPITFTNNYFQSDAFRNRFMRSGLPFQLKEQNDKLHEAMASYHPFILNQDPNGIGSRGATPDMIATFNRFLGKGQSPIPSNTSIVLSKPQIDQLHANMLNSVLPHEYAHQARKLTSGEELSIGQLSNDRNAFQNSYVKYLQANKNPDLDFSAWLKNGQSNLHDKAPDEMYSDLNALRWLMYRNNAYDVNKGDLDINTLKKALQNPEIGNDFSTKRLLKHFTPENLVQFNNTIAGSPMNTPTSRWGGRTKTTPQYLSTYPETQKPMRRNLRGRMRVGGQHFDPQLGNYKSNIYAAGGLASFGYPYYGYNDSERAMLSGMMQLGGYPSYPPNYRPHPYNMPPFLWGGDVPDARNHSVSDGVKTGRVTYSRYPNNSPDEFGDYDWTTTPSGGYRRGGMHAPRPRRKAVAPGAIAAPMGNPPTQWAPQGVPPQAAVNGGGPNSAQPQFAGGGHWIQKAINPKHKGYCTPMSKPTCTGRRRALALLFKRKHGFHKADVGGLIPGQYLQGTEFQVGGLTSFTPAGSLIDQNQWAMNPDSSPMAPVNGNYYKTDPSQTTAAVQGSTVPVSYSKPSSPRPGSNSFGMPNLNNLRWLLPANAIGSGLAQANQWNQNQSWRRSNMNNPMTTEGWANGRTSDSRFGYGTSIFQQGGVNQQAKSREGYISFAGRPLKLWQMGGNTSTTSYHIPTPNLLRDSNGRILNPSYEFLPRGSAQDSSDYRSGFYNTIRRERSGNLHPRQEPVFYYDQSFTPGDNRNDNNLYTPGHNVPYNQGVSEAYMNTRYAMGGDTGATTVLRPYMLHQGRFQDGGQMSQWDLEDDEDMEDQQGSGDNMDDTEYQRRADLTDDEDYQMALQVAMQSNPYWG